jgi:molybdopterin converting factor small subunit
MITVHVRLFATLLRFFPDLQLGETMQVNLPDGSTVGQLIERLNIPVEEIKIVFVNNIFRDMGYALKNGDTVGIFPPVGGG